MNKSVNFALSLGLCFGFLLSLSPSVQAQSKVKRADPGIFFRPPSTITGKMMILPIGTTFEGRMNLTVSSAKSKPGQAFSIVLASPVLANGVDVVIPAGAEVVGEVVEAISAKSQKKRKGMPAPKGKLRIMVNMLRLPDGTTFPLVGNLIGEDEAGRGRGRGGRGSIQTQLGSGVGYIGSSEAFENIAPGAKRYGQQYTPGRGPDYVKKREFLAHEIYGTGGDDFKNVNPDDRRIRSLVLRKQDLWIDQGSPLTVKLQAPLRLSFTPNNQGAPVGAETTEAPDSLPPPSSQGNSADIPPITSDPGEAAPLPPRRRPQEQQAPLPAAQSPAPTPPQSQPVNPSASPSADF